MLLVPLGSTETIGASCHYLQVDGTGILLDAGVDPEHDGPKGLPCFDALLPRREYPVDHVVVTHAHHDHLGGLPVAIREFPTARVHMTPATRVLADVLLPASARLQKRKLKEGSSIHQPIFDEAELEMLAYLYEDRELDERFSLSGRGGTPVAARLMNSGHILGSAGISLTYREHGAERTFFYTSDTNVHHQTIIPGAVYPEQVDTLMIETTACADPDAELYSRRGEERRLGEAIERVLAGGGTVLIPVFALGRAQEVLALIQRYKDRRVIPFDTPVYTAGSMRAVAGLYDRMRTSTPRLNPDFEVEQVDQLRVPRSHSRIAETLSEPSIHVVSSGMMFERTLSNQLATMVVESERNAVFFVGYVRDDSPGGALLNAERGDSVQISPDAGEQVVNCHVDRFRLSGHSHRQDLLALVGRLAPRDVVLVHGESTAQEWMRSAVESEFPGVNVITPTTGKEINL